MIKVVAQLATGPFIETEVSSVEDGQVLAQTYVDHGYNDGNTYTQVVTAEIVIEAEGITR